MPRTMTAEREADARKFPGFLKGIGAELLAELDAERAESQRLQSRVEALEGALRKIQSKSTHNYSISMKLIDVAWKPSDPVWPPPKRER